MENTLLVPVPRVALLVLIAMRSQTLSSAQYFTLTYRYHVVPCGTGLFCILQSFFLVFFCSFFCSQLVSFCSQLVQSSKLPNYHVVLCVPPSTGLFCSLFLQSFFVVFFCSLFLQSFFVVFFCSFFCSQLVSFCSQLVQFSKLPDQPSALQSLPTTVTSQKIMSLKLPDQPSTFYFLASFHPFFMILDLFKKSELQLHLYCFRLQRLVQ